MRTCTLHSATQQQQQQRQQYAEHRRRRKQSTVTVLLYNTLTISLSLYWSLIAARATASTAGSAFSFSLDATAGRGFRQRRFLAIRGGSTTATPSKNHTQLMPENNTQIMNENPDQVIGGGAINEKKRTYMDRLETSSHGDHHHQQQQQALSSDHPTTNDGVISSSSSSSVFQGTRNQAHFLHAMEGLDRYPNYVSRWNAEDADDLEQALQQRLEKVRLQRKNAQLQHDRFQQVIQIVCQDEPQWKEFIEPPRTWEDVRKLAILDARTYQALVRSKFFRSSQNYTVPSVVEVLSGRARVELDAGQLEDLMDEEVFDVYSFPLLSESFCKQLQAYTRRVMDELDNIKDPDFTAGGQRKVRNLDNLGLAWLNDLLFQLVVRPISRHLYQETEMGGDRERNVTGDLDWRHGFIAAYAAKPDALRPRQRLVPHTDDAEVTLNVCIGDVFEGGKLNFWGLRGTDMAGTLVGDYTPQPGRALLHAGRQLHEVTEVTEGERFALIMWTRSWGGIRSTTCPCCWLNRRTGEKSSQSSCTCSARWN